MKLRISDFNSDFQFRFIVFKHEPIIIRILRTFVRKNPDSSTNCECLGCFASRFWLPFRKYRTFLFHQNWKHYWLFCIFGSNPGIWRQRNQNTLKFEEIKCLRSVFGVILGEINQAIRQIFRRGKIIGGDEIFVIHNPLKDCPLQHHGDHKFFDSPEFFSYVIFTNRVFKCQIKKMFCCKVKGVVNNLMSR